ncbi:MAG: lysophospholipid acyltransferase family protein [Saprospiraceae bacterium]|nr:lysophospholipid acyltransferase family protein [Saprospiraceae bacterium]
MQRFGYYSLLLLIQLFRFVPFGALYVLSNGLAFVLYRVIGYRKKVVNDNLRRVFPEKSPAEIEQIARKSYRNLTDITLESIKAFTLSKTAIAQRCPCINPEVVNAFLDRGQSVIVGGSHYNNWELACLTIPGGFHAPAITVYKPLSNKIMDAYFNRNRARGGMEMVDMETVFSTMRKRRDETAAWFLVSDQSPSSRKNAHWVSFLGQDSASLPGVDLLARKFNYPVLYFHIARIKRGYYELRYETLWPEPATAAPEDITRAYAQKAEAYIYDQPENWLWSHKRWKITRSV